MRIPSFVLATTTADRQASHHIPTSTLGTLDEQTGPTRPATAIHSPASPDSLSIHRPSHSPQTAYNPLTSLSSYHPLITPHSKQAPHSNHPSETRSTPSLPPSLLTSPLPSFIHRPIFIDRIFILPSIPLTLPPGAMLPHRPREGSVRSSATTASVSPAAFLDPASIDLSARMGARWAGMVDGALVDHLGLRERTRQEVLWEIVASEQRSPCFSFLLNGH